MQWKYHSNDAMKWSERKTRGVDNLGPAYISCVHTHVTQASNSLFSRGSSYVDFSLYFETYLEMSNSCKNVH